MGFVEWFFLELIGCISKLYLIIFEHRIFHSMKKALLPIALITILSLFIYSCSSGDDDNSSKLSSEISAPTSSSNQNDNQEEFNLSISANEGGVVSSSGGKYLNGSSISVSATPNNGFEFAGWSNGSKQNPLSITLTSNQSITANFNKKTYKLEINLDGEGIVEKELISGEGSLDIHHLDQLLN